MTDPFASTRARHGGAVWPHSLTRADAAPWMRLAADQVGELIRDGVTCETSGDAVAAARLRREAIAAYAAALRRASRGMRSVQCVPVAARVVHDKWLDERAARAAGGA